MKVRYWNENHIFIFIRAAQQLQFISLYSSSSLTVTNDPSVARLQKKNGRESRKLQVNCKTGPNAHMYWKATN